MRKNLKHPAGTFSDPEKLKEYFKRKSHENYLKNRDFILKRTAQWGKENPDKRREAVSKWRSSNPEKVKQRTVEWVAEHQKEILAYRERNKDKTRERRKKWQESNREKTRASWRRHKSRKLNAPGQHHTPEDVKRLFLVQWGIRASPYCNEPLVSYHVDHVMPLSRGGSNGPENIQLLCVSCNTSKHARTMDEFIAWKEKVLGL